MSEAMGIVRDLHDPLAMRMPIAHEFPRAGIIRRLLTGIALVIAAGVLGFFGGIFWLIAALLAIFGSIVNAGNLRALLEAEWRKITLDRDRVEIRYGFSERSYGFLEYSDYYISPWGLRRFLTALPVEIEFAEDRITQRTHATPFERPAFIIPMPPFGNGSPASLSEWRSLLNGLRHKAIESAHVASKLASHEATNVAADSLLRQRNNAQGL